MLKQEVSSIILGFYTFSLTQSETEKEGELKREDELAVCLQPHPFPCWDYDSSFISVFEQYYNSSASRHVIMVIKALF
jgi:hypothetical protein